MEFSFVKRLPSLPCIYLTSRLLEAHHTPHVVLLNRETPGNSITKLSTGEIRIIDFGADLARGGRNTASITREILIMKSRAVYRSKTSF